MKKLIPIACILAMFGSNISVFAQYANLEFIENKGQWDPAIKYRGLMNNGAFYLQGKGFRVVQSDEADLAKLAASFHAEPATKKIINRQFPISVPRGEIIVHSHAYDVQFINAGNPSIVPDKPLNTVSNFFIGNDPSKWKSNCQTFQAITYQNMYPGVDVRYYTNNGRLKYDIIVNPSADANRIAMKYDGVEDLQVKNEQLIIKTSIGETKELAPYAYQVVDGVKKEVACRFKVTGKTVQFSLGSYNRNALIVIDPTLIFSTFTGSVADNWGYTATYGPDGSFYAGGVVFGPGFPTSPGAYQTAYGGGKSDEEGIPGHDIGIMKFDPNGVSRVYATYIGGTGNEAPHSLVVDGQGQLVIAGKTNSDNFPTTAPMVGPGGKYDIILTKLNATGSALIGSRKIGGTENDGVNVRLKYAGTSGSESIRRNYGDDARSEVILDGAGNIYLASCTQSVGDDASKNFPVTANAFQRSPGANQLPNKNTQDGVVLKASPNLSNILFASFLGGSNDDAAFVLALNPSNNEIYVGGSTVSSNLPGNTAGVVNPNFQGGSSDGYVSIISNDGSSILKTSYFGTSGVDMLYGIQFDRFSFPYIMGTTTGTWPVLNAAFSQPGGKQYISKLKPDLSAYEYSTIYGTNSTAPNISPIAFLVDKCENVYVSGWGGDINVSQKYANSGTTGLSVTSDAMQSKTDGSDFYFFVLEKNARSQLYGSFFGQFSTNGGGEHVDGGTSRFDRDGVIYQALCANCERTATFPTTPGVWSPTNGSTHCNLAAVKIAFNLAGISNGIRSSVNGVPRDNSGCVPLTVDFTDTVASGQTYIWNFGDGSPDTTTTTANASHTYLTIGNFSVRLISIDSSSCNIADTSYTNIRVSNNEAILGFNMVKTGTCQSTTYQFTNTSTISSGQQPFSNTSFVWDFGDNSPREVRGLQPFTHSFPGNGTYRVRLLLVDTSFCNAPDSLIRDVRISPNVQAQFKTPASGCEPYTAVIENTSAGGQQFYWDFGDGTTSTETNPKHLYANAGTYTIRLLAVDSATCNISDSAKFTITVSEIPVAAFTFTPVPPQENTPVEFTNTSIGATRYKWIFGDGDTLNTASTLPIKHIYNETKRYTACLIAINDAGCMDTTCQEIQAKVIPLLDVPNAFTPNGDGTNDRVFVRGYGITKMTWRIYNRWGTVVFQTSDRSQGWDGKYNGKLQPKEVYNYVLDVEFGDGTKHRKKGDITLL